MEVQRRCWLVEGQVQGVFFRQSTVEEAARIGGLRGWVRNLDDGRVEVRVEGPAAAVQALRSYVERGPPSARVRRVTEAEPGRDEYPNSFEVMW